MPSAAQGCLAPKPTRGRFFSGALRAWICFGSETSPGRSGGSPEMGNGCSVGKPSACPSSRGKAWLVLVEKSQRSHLGVLLSIPSFLRGQRVWCAWPADGGRCRDKEQPWKWCWGNLPPADRGHGTLLLGWDQPQPGGAPFWGHTKLPPPPPARRSEVTITPGCNGDAGSGARASSRAAALQGPPLGSIPAGSPQPPTHPRALRALCSAGIGLKPAAPPRGHVPPRGVRAPADET